MPSAPLPCSCSGGDAGNGGGSCRAPLGSGGTPGAAALRPAASTAGLTCLSTASCSGACAPDADAARWPAGVAHSDVSSTAAAVLLYGREYAWAAGRLWLVLLAGASCSDTSASAASPPNLALTSLYAPASESAPSAYSPSSHSASS